MSEAKSIYAALMAVQQGINAPKDKKGYGYEYRTADGILQAAKPLLKEQGVICILSDESKQMGDRYYIKATAKLIDIATGDCLEAYGEAVEPDKLASMAPPQITGTASTYARKRALEGLFLLDNEKDVDSKEVQDAIKNSRQQAQAPTPKPPTIQQQTAELLRNFGSEANRAGIDNGLIGQVIKYKYNKTGKELTMAEASELVNNFAQFRDEMLKEGAA